MRRCKQITPLVERMIPSWGLYFKVISMLAKLQKTHVDHTDAMDAHTMEKKDSDDAKRVLSVLSEPRVRALIDRKKLRFSSIFEGIAKMSVEHAIRYGDRTFIARTLKLVDSTRYHLPILKWFCARGSLNYKVQAGKLIFSRSDTAPDESADLNDFLLGEKGTQRQASTSMKAGDSKVTRMKQKKKKKDPWEKRIDALDSRARLPGSYETGKRR